ncbi:Brix domain-containing protein [Lipomyces oligophaga]|uniref:Brix domain-containing protein n=1 Tax=Lipomyces oligophaga TaxID=45792 RepID=UPI0034CD3F72
MASLYKTLSGTKRKRGEDAEKSNMTASEGIKNRQRVLMLSSRGVTFRQRHLINDLAVMLPHAKKDSKFDSKSKLYLLNELADMYNCNNVLYFESRKHQDLYMFVSKTPNGPTAKFHIQNMHTMAELNFTGNALKGSRPLLSFGKEFDEHPQYQLVKEMLVHVFGVPKSSRKTKPFVDHVLGFSIVDGKIWFRNYQIAESIDTTSETKINSEDQELENDGNSEKKKKKLALSLVEIGPRFVMTLVSVLEGSFSGPLIFENKEFVSPNAIRSDTRKNKTAVRVRRQEQEHQKKIEKNLKAKQRKARGADPLADNILFA